MTTQTQYAAHVDRRGAGWPLFAALGAGTALVLSAIAVFWDITGNDGSPEPHPVREYLVVAAVILVATALLYGLVVRTAASGNAGLRALILAVLGFVSLIAFWSGLPVVFGFAAAACVLGAASDGTSGMGKAALGIAGVTLVLAVVGAIAG